MIFVSNKDTMNLIFVSSGEPDRWHNQGGDATERPAGKPGKGNFIIINKQGAYRKTNQNANTVLIFLLAHLW